MIVLFLDESGWAEHRTRDGYKYYYNKNTEEYSWTRPSTWSGVSQDLSREEIQVSNTHISRYGLYYHLNRLLSLK